jgi:hypothetical protein
VKFVKNVAETAQLGGDGASGETPALEEAIPSRKDRHYRSGKRKGRYHLVKHTWRTRKDPFEDVKTRSTTSCADVRTSRPKLSSMGSGSDIRGSSRTGRFGLYSAA